MTMAPRGRQTARLGPAQLLELKELAEESTRMKAAIRSLDTKRYTMMQIVREGPAGTPEVELARGWLQAFDDLGDALIGLGVANAAGF